VELGVSTEADRGAGPRTPSANGLHRAVTEHILGLADEAGRGAALIDAVGGTVTPWPQFALVVRAAAHGLSLRGLRDRDTVGIFVPDAVSHAVAVHAVRTAGGTAWPIPPETAVADLAAELKSCQARLLITAAPLAERAVQAAERSWVRQVFAFGEAAGTTPFGSLLQAARHPQHAGNGHADQAADSIAARISGLAGLPAADLPRLTRCDVVVAAPPCGAGDGYTSLLDLALVAGATVVAAPVAQIADAIRTYHGTAAIVPRGTRIEGIPAARLLSVG
jgi:AMP-binding enzyme